MSSEGGEFAWDLESLKRMREAAAEPVTDEERVLAELKSKRAEQKSTDHDYREKLEKLLERWALEENAREVKRAREIEESLEGLDLDRALRRGADVVMRTEVPWLVHERLHETGIAQLAAQYYQGKSLLAVSLAMAVCNRMPEWLGQPVDRGGPVVYLAAESTVTVEIAIDAWLKDNPGTTTDDMALVDEEFPIDFSNESSTELLDQALDELFPEGTEQPVLVVGDTQIDLVGPEGAEKENTPELGVIVGRIRKWAVKRGCCFVLVHHAPHDKERGRGTTAQFGKADTLLFLHPTSGAEEVKELEWQKVKGAQKPTDRKSLEILSVPGSRGAVIKPTTAAGLLAAAARVDWDFRRDVWEAVGSLVSGGSPAGKNAVSDWLKDHKKGKNSAAIGRELIEMANEGYLKVAGKLMGKWPHYEQDRMPEDPTGRAYGGDADNDGSDE